MAANQQEKQLSQVQEVQAQPNNDISLSDVQLSETQVADVQSSEAQVADVQSSEAQVADVQSSEAQVADNDLLTDKSFAQKLLDKMHAQAKERAEAAQAKVEK